MTPVASVGFNPTKNWQKIPRHLLPNFNIIGHTPSNLFIFQ